MKEKIKVVGFDADDTLWVNEPIFQDIEHKFIELLKPHLAETVIAKELFETEMRNLDLYGYGVKSFILSMIETALRISQNAVKTSEIEQIIKLGKEMLTHPVVLLDGVENVLQVLQSKYRLILATKGDLLDQERKLEKSGLAKYFHHIEIMSDKTEIQYKSLLKHLDIQPHEFVMVGNSMKSDIMPVISIGAYGVFVPFATTWAHEVVKEEVTNDKIIKVHTINQIINYL